MSEKTSMTMKQRTGRQLRAVWTVTALIIALAVFIGASGYLIYHRYQASYRDGIENQLEAVAELKIRQIQEWRRERISDAEGMYLNNIVLSRIIERLKGDKSPGLKLEIQALLNTFGHKQGYVNHYLLTPDAAVDLSSAPEGSQIPPAIMNRIREVTAQSGQRQIHFIDFHRLRQDGLIEIDILVPVTALSGGRHTLLGYILMEIDPEQYLFPLIQAWPSPSRTAETLLVRREGSDVLYLNELRHRKGTALNLRFPVSDPDLPAAMALRGETGMVEGKDYRGVDVVAMIKKVPDSPWYIVSKIDRDEIYAPIRNAARVIALITSLTFLAFGGAVMAFWMKWQADQYRSMTILESQKAALARRLESLMQNAGDAILITGEDWKIREVNKRAVEMYGYMREELIGMSMMRLRAPDARREFNHDMSLVLEHGMSMHETSDIRKDGTIFPAEISLNALEIEGIRYFQSIIRDITERRKAETALQESREDLNRAQAVAHTGSWRLDVRKNELLWSDENYRIFGVPKGTPQTYETFLGIVHPDDREYVDRKWTAAMHGEPYDIDHRIIAGNTVKWVRERAQLDFDTEGKLLGGFGTTQDITEKKQAEEEIRRFNTELEQLVNERTAKLETANRELESFSYSVSHDLRSPLRAIEGFTRILEEDYSGKIDEEGRRVLSVIIDNTARMGKLIEDLLAFSRVGRHELKRSSVDMEAMVRSVFDETVSPQDAQRIDITVRHLPGAFADASLMRQVWANLISNAVKFSAKKEKPLIEIGGSTVDGESTYYVKDNGAGFDMAYAGKLFGVFQRLHSAKEFEGTGVGLAIAQRIILRHDGRIWAEASPGNGATFTFALPAYKPGNREEEIGEHENS